MAGRIREGCIWLLLSFGIVVGNLIETKEGKHFVAQMCNKISVQSLPTNKDYIYKVQIFVQGKHFVVQI